MEEIEKPTEEKKRRSHPAEQRCRAVLAVWTERRNPGEVCQELGISWSVLNQWQERAMEGMIQALQPRIPAEKGVALNPRLALLLDRKAKTLKGLERRLAKLQVNKEAIAEKKV
jgi:transposase-like protein